MSRIAIPPFFAVVAVTAFAGEPLRLGSRLELFVDHHLVSELRGAELRLGQPRREEIVLRFDQPWEGPFAGAFSVLKDGPIYRMYYRGVTADAAGDYDISREVTCYAESRDGIHWKKPNLGLHEYNGSRANNIIIPPGYLPRVAHNFAVFVDGRPGVPDAERYKAVGGVKASGLWRHLSADGIHWRLFSEKPLFLGYALDTLNIAMWSPSEQAYVAYIRTWSDGGTPDHPAFKGYRSISRSTSRDFINWSEPVQVTFGDTPVEHLYTIGAHPYFRAPHLLIALPFRFAAGRRVLTQDEVQTMGVLTPPGREGHGLGGVSDAVMMTSRGGNTFDRIFMESFIRPGLDRVAWTARSNVPGFGVVPTGDNELSIYTTVGYTTRDYHIRRYSLRIDGFASLHAGFAGGELLTKPLVFTGQRLAVNYSTSSVGSVKVEILDSAGSAMPGFSREECDEIVGDEVARTVTWKGDSGLEALAGRPVRLRIFLRDADVFSLQFK